VKKKSIKEIVAEIQKSHEPIGGKIVEKVSTQESDESGQK